MRALSIVASLLALSGFFFSSYYHVLARLGVMTPKIGQPLFLAGFLLVILLFYSEREYPNEKVPEEQKLGWWVPQFRNNPRWIVHATAILTMYILLTIVVMSLAGVQVPVPVGPRRFPTPSVENSPVWLSLRTMAFMYLYWFAFTWSQDLGSRKRKIEAVEEDDGF